MSFFQLFPKTTYDFQLNGIRNSIIDIFRYVDVLDDLVNNFTGYQFIDIQDGERPDQLSMRLYGTPDYYWTFFVMNDFLKDGLRNWPKGSYELSQAIDDYYGKYHVFSIPPSIDSQNSQILHGLDGIPINDEDYKGNLYFLRPTLPQDHPSLDHGFYWDFIGYKISHWDPINYLLWVEKNKTCIYRVNWDSDEVVSNAVGISDDLDVVLKSYYESFFFDKTALDFIDCYVRYESGDDTIRAAWIDDIETVIQSGLTTDDSQETALKPLVYDHWKVAKNAPYRYYSSEDSQDFIRSGYEALIGDSQYNTDYRSTNYQTIEEFLIELNDERKRIKVVRPRYITQFVEEFDRLINL